MAATPFRRKVHLNITDNPSLQQEMEIVSGNQECKPSEGNAVGWEWDGSHNAQPN